MFARPFLRVGGVKPGYPCAKAPLADEGIALVFRGVKMSELCDSSAGTRNKASVSAFSRREEEHIT